MRINIDDVGWDQNQRAVTGDDPITGEVVEYDAAGHLLALAHYEDGVKSGPEKSFYRDGSVEFEGEWCWGHGVGVHRTWHPNGQLKVEQTFGEPGRPPVVHRYAPDGTLLDSPRKQS